MRTKRSEIRTDKQAYGNESRNKSEIDQKAYNTTAISVSGTQLSVPSKLPILREVDLSSLGRPDSKGKLDAAENRPVA